MHTISKTSLADFIAEARELGPKCWLGTLVKRNADGVFLNLYVQASAFAAVAPGVFTPIVYRQHLGTVIADRDAQSMLDSATDRLRHALEADGMVVYPGIMTDEPVSATLT